MIRYLPIALLTFVVYKLTNNNAVAFAVFVVLFIAQLIKFGPAPDDNG